MAKDVDSLIKVLRNRDSGWVHRRDAAEALGKTGAEIADTLRSLLDDSDVDVRRSIKEALGWASAGLRNVRPIPQNRPYTLEELAKACERPGRREVAKEGDGYIVTATLREGRTQRVDIKPYTPKDGKNLIRVYTRCGKPTEEAYLWALKTNMSLSHGALALTEENGEEIIVMTNCFLADETTPEEIKAAVKELAFYGDYIEKKLTKLDEF